ncbi:MAG: general secretion pathway protein GspK [bacterium]
MSRGEKGIALMMTLWILLLLSFVALEFAHSMRTEVEVTKNFRDEIQAYYLALGGIELGRYELAVSGSLEPQCRDPETQRVVFGKGEGNECKSPPECRVFELSGGTCDYRFETAADKYPLNLLAEKKHVENLKKFLEKYCGVEAFTEEIGMIAYSIIDWKDSDDSYSLPGIGAEDDWYKSHDQGYECKDADFDSMDELSWVRGLRIEDGDSEEEMERKKGIVNTFKRYFDVIPELENAGVSRDLIKLNLASSGTIQVLYNIELIAELPETIEEKKAEKCGCYDNKGATAYFYVISTAVMNDSPVQRAIKASFFKQRGRKNADYWKLLYWNDNYIREYDDPNQTGTSRQEYDD